MAQSLSNTLYGKRFFPFYTFNILAGLDADGTGAVYSYDAVGSYERTGYAAQGTGKQPSYMHEWAMSRLLSIYCCGLCAIPPSLSICHAVLACSKFVWQYHVHRLMPGLEAILLP